jgi:N6-L-threonylcarbamoyladenine synthase
MATHSKKQKTLIFSVETSCDETAMAIVEARGGIENPHFRIVKNRVLSQITAHREFGGVVPNIAKREHDRALPELFKEFENLPEFKKANLISVTVGPGLEPALWTGVEFAKNLRKTTNKKIFPADHIKGHLYSFLLSNPRNFKNLFPMIALVVSGGHTILFLLESIGSVKKLGETRDDAAGEAFDKGARLLGLPYPGGPELESLAKNGNPNAFNFPRPMINQKNFDFSFAGLKTALLYKLKNDNKADWKDINLRAVSGEHRNLALNKSADIASSYEQAIIDCLVSKSFKATEKFKAHSVTISGGVSANSLLRQEFAREAKKRKIRFIAPKKEWSTDNAIMIAVASYIESQKGVRRALKANSALATKS